MMNPSSIRESVVIPQQDVFAELDAVASRAEVLAAIRKCKNRRSGGLDHVVAEYLKYGGEVVVDKLHRLIVDCWETGSVPQSWKDSEIINISKKGNLSSVDNWRGISLLSVAGKVLTSIVGKRLQEVVVPLLVQDSQYGFRTNRSRADAIHVVRCLMKWIDQCVDEELHLVFYDIKKFYDTIPRELLWKVLARVVFTSHDYYH